MLRFRFSFAISAWGPLGASAHSTTFEGEEEKERGRKKLPLQVGRAFEAELSVSGAQS